MSRDIRTGPARGRTLPDEAHATHTAAAAHTAAAPHPDTGTPTAGAPHTHTNRDTDTAGATPTVTAATTHPDTAQLPHAHGQQAPALLRFDRVVKRYRRGPLAADAVSFTVARGETVALVGESGSGKSTLARLALGLLAPDAGAVSFDGHAPHRLRGAAGRRVRARLQFVPQQPRGSLNPALRAGEAVAFALRVHGTPRAERPARVAELFERVGLDPALARRLPRELSGGQVQRVALARALATGPELLVCDEPTSALDTTVQAQILDLLTELRERLGLGCLFISHDLAVVRRLAHRVVVLRAGRVVEQAATGDLWSAPCHPYTRALLGADDDGAHPPPTPAGTAEPAPAGEPSAP